MTRSGRIMNVCGNCTLSLDTDRIWLDDELEAKRLERRIEARNGYGLIEMTRTNPADAMSADEKRDFIAKADAIIQRAMRGMGPSPEAVRAVLMNESGPGIAATKPDDAQWFDPIDCLADDA